MTRAALLLTGNARFCKDFDSQLENLTRADVDWFVYLWDKDHSSDTCISPNWKCTTEDHVVTRLTPMLPPRHRLRVVRILPAMPQLTKEYTPFYANPYNFISQYTILKEAGKSISDEYDIVIRSRSDIGIDRPLDLSWLDSYLNSSVNRNEIVIPLNERRGPHDFCDQFAIGNPLTMQKYINVVDDIDRVYNEGTPFNPEYIIGRSLRDQGIFWRPAQFNINLRVQGHHVPGHFHPEFGRWL